MGKVQIIPAILATTEEEYKEKVSKINTVAFLVNNWVQIDFMDNKFVQNRSISPAVINKYKLDSSLKIEAHLMVEYPENWIDELINVSVDRIVSPAEDVEGLMERIEHIQNHGIKVGLSINPETDPIILEDYLEFLDVVLVMSVHPGFQGQEFIPQVLDKIPKIKKMKSDVLVGVDGGIGPDNAKSVVNAGADYLVLGSTLFKYDNLEEGLEKTQETING